MRHEGALAGEVRAGVLQGARGGGPDEGGAAAAGVSEFREIRVSNAGADGAHSFDRAAEPTPPPAPAGGRPRGSFYDPDNVDPDYAPGGGMNASQFRAEPVPPIAPSNYKAPQRREIVDPDNFDPDFQPRAPANFGSSAAAPATPAAPRAPSSYAAPTRREIVDPDNIDPDFQPRAPAKNGSSPGGSPSPSSPASNVVSPRATQGDRGPGQHRPGFPVNRFDGRARGRVTGRVRWMLVVA